MRRGKSVSRQRLLAGMAISLALTVAGAPPALANSVTPSTVNGLQHFLDCLAALVEDPLTHHQFCGPNPYAPTDQLAPTVPGGGAADSCRTVGSRAGGPLGLFASLEADPFRARATDVLSQPFDLAVDSHCYCVPCSNDASVPADGHDVQVASIEKEFIGTVGRAGPSVLQFACCNPQN